MSNPIANTPSRGPLPARCCATCRNGVYVEYKYAMKKDGRREIRIRCLDKRGIEFSGRHDHQKAEVVENCPAYARESCIGNLLSSVLYGKL